MTSQNMMMLLTYMNLSYATQWTLSLGKHAENGGLAEPSPPHQQLNDGVCYVYLLHISLFASRKEC